MYVLAHTKAMLQCCVFLTLCSVDFFPRHSLQAIVLCVVGCRKMPQIAVFGAGDVFGTNSVREATVICQQHSSELLVIPTAAYEELLKSKPTGGIDDVTTIFSKG